MTTAPKYAEDADVPKVQFNARFEEKGEGLLPELHSTLVVPNGTVTFEADPSAYFGLKKTIQYTLPELESRLWGRNDEFILDFGSHFVGYLKFHLEAEGNHVDAPARIRLTFGEIPFDVTENLYPCNTWISTSWLPDELFNIDWIPCDFAVPRRHAWQFIRVQIIDTSDRFKLRFKNIYMVAITSVSKEQEKRVAPFPFKNLLLQAIDRVSMNTLRNCMQTVFEDGPRGDRRLWSGDLRLQALTNYCTFRHFDLVKRCLYLFASLAREDGSLPACLFEKPTLRAGSNYIVDYDVLFGKTVFEYVTASGDVTTGKELWTTILGTTTVPLKHIKSHVFKCTESSSWKFLDWNDELHRDASMQGVMIVGLSAINDLATLLGKERPFDDVVMQLRDASMSAFFDADSGVFVSGDEKQVSWASQAWMTLAGVSDSKTCKKALLRTMANKEAIKPSTPYLYHHVAEALCEVNAEKECLDLICKYWGGMIRAGAESFWEAYDPEDARSSPYGDCHNNSYCHAWSCTPSFLLRVKLKAWIETEHA